MGLAFLSSCVPARKYEDAKTRMERVESELIVCKENNEDLKAQNTRIINELEETNRTLTRLRQDTADYGTKFRNIEQLNNRLNELYEKVIAQNKDLLQNTSKEREKMALELNEKEKQLREKEFELQKKETNIASLQAGLAEREKRVAELEGVINRQDSIVNALKNRVAEALLGFNSNELTVEMRNGKVYVSLAEQLLFKSGSTAVDPKGRDALQKLADVLKRNPDIDVLIEGHTDNVPIRGSATMKDNWDLSVLRATSIVRIVQDRGVDPKRLIPSGRGEYFPVATNETAAGRSQNRRTEIILSPKLDELYNLLQTNK